MKTKLVGSSVCMKNILISLELMSKSDKNILLCGETGSGKNLAARKIHELSERRTKPFVEINCSNIPDNLFESELFGFAKGAFTGANERKKGLVEIAGGGTIFFDEIGELSISIQAKLLRLLDYKKVRRVGDTQPYKVEARFIFATNKELHFEVRNGKFRRDLYYRINVLTIRIPSLRERRDDISELANYFLANENLLYGLSKSLTNDALEKIENHDFLGNIRELRNVIERAYILSEGNLIHSKDVMFEYKSYNRDTSTKLSHESLKRALEQCRWNKTKTALFLGKSRRHLYRLLDKHRMTDYIRKI